MHVSVENDPEFASYTPRSTSRQRITVMRVIVKLGIVSFFLAFLFTSKQAYDSAREAARSIQCVNNLRQIALALNNYEQEYKALPPAHTVDATGRPLHSWRTLILPYLEQESLYKTIDLSKPWNDPVNAKALETQISAFHCVMATGPENTTTYLAIRAPGGCFLPHEPRPLKEITDDPWLTLMVIEAGEENAVPWMAPVDADESLVMSLGPNTKLHHAGGTNVCLVDGGVRFLKATTPTKVRRALISISGNDHVAYDVW